MWIPAKHHELVKFANKEEIQDYIDGQYLPKYLGGQCERNFAVAPPECRSVSEMADRWGFANEEINEYLKIFGPQIKETKRVMECEK